MEEKKTAEEGYMYISLGAIEDMSDGMASVIEGRMVFVVWKWWV